MNRKIKYFIGTLSVCFMLTGCCMSHEWKEATCTEPKTCAKCGKTEGEALGHTWVEATCAETKHCSVCGETEGEPLAHTWVEATCKEAKHCSVCGETEGNPLEHTLTEANYQQAATCEVCGETVGEPLTPAFVEHNVKGQFMELGKTYDYVTSCWKDKNVETVGRATITDYQTFASDDTHEAKEGYEWKTVELQIVFSDDNAWNYGIDVEDCDIDYYDIVGHDESSVDDENGTSFTASWNGQNYTECRLISNGSFSGWEDQTDILTINKEFLIPVGYDGILVGIYDASMREGGQYIYDVANDDTLFFCLD